MQQLETKMDKVSFVRVDADTVDALIEKEETVESVLNEEEQKQVTTVFEGVTEGVVGASVNVKALSPEDAPVVITKNEFMRRFAEMQALQGNSGMGAFPESYNLVVNSNHPLIANKLLKGEEAEQKDLAKYLYDLALLNQGMLKGKALAEFTQKALSFVG
jgi:molecular chaperone HtpG